jgi:hypothetical protein
MRRANKAAIIRRLRAQGWRVRDGGWPATLAAEARYDLCVIRNSEGAVTVFSMTPEAGKAMKENLLSLKMT